MARSPFLRLATVTGGLAALTLLSTDLVAQKRASELPITTSSKEALALFQQARDKVDNVEFAAAAPLLDQALRKDPDFAMAYAYRAQAGGGFNVFRQNLDKAIGLADKVSPGERAWILALQAQADGNTVKLKEQVDELLRLYPADKRVQTLAGNYYGSFAVDLKAALEHFQKATAIDKSFAAAYNQAGYAEFRMGNYAAAEVAFKQYIALRPADPNPYDSYAELLLKTGRYDESIAQYQKAVEKDPAFAGALTGVGHNYVFKGDYARARESYQRGFDQSPNVNGKLAAMFWRSVSYVHEGNIAEALRSLDETRMLAEKQELAPAAINAQLQAAFILAERDQLGQSVSYLESASKALDQASLPPATRDTLRLNAMASRAFVLAAVHEFDAARALAEKCRVMAQTLENANAERGVQTVLAQIALEEGRHDAALEHLGKADQEDPYNWFYRARALDGKGDKAAASLLYEKVAGWNQNSLEYALVRGESLRRTANR